MIAFGRPDLLGFWAVALTGLATNAPTRKARLALLALTGALVTVLVLMHEGVLVSFVPWLVLLLVTSWDETVPWSRRLHEVAVAFTGPLMAAAAVATIGLPGPVQVQQLRAAAAPDLMTTKVSSVLDYLGEGVQESVQEVMRLDPVSIAGMGAVGLAILALHAVAIRLCGLRITYPFRQTRAKVLAATLLVPAFAFQLATGFEWSRWIALWTANWLLAMAVMLLRSDPLPTTIPPGRGATAALVASGVAMALIPQSPPYNLSTCSYTYIAHEWATPFARIADLARGNTEKTYPRWRCGNLGEERARHPR